MLIHFQLFFDHFTVDEVLQMSQIYLDNNKCKDIKGKLFKFSWKKAEDDM